MELSNKRTHMPIGNYSNWNETDAQRPYAIVEPHAGPGVQAKEPDRQSTTRRQSSRSRAGVDEDYQQEDQPRSRSATRGGSRRGTQARRAAGQTTRRTAASETRTGRQKKSRRGFAAMSPEQQREIARKGGLTVSRNRRHMADIGRVGGEHSHGGRRARR